MKKLNKIQKRIRIVGIICGVIPLGMLLVPVFPPIALLYTFGGWRWIFLLPVALTLMLVDIGIAIYKSLIKGENK